jgi:Ca2+-binding EF-hand superfamily protein
MLDPKSTGSLDFNTFAVLLTMLGYPEMSREDTDTVLAACDFDGDGKISLEDFKKKFASDQ